MEHGRRVVEGVASVGVHVDFGVGMVAEGGTDLIGFGNGQVLVARAEVKLGAQLGTRKITVNTDADKSIDEHGRINDGHSQPVPIT